MIIGLTGPSGAGKSLVAMEFNAHGWYVIDADRATHDLYACSSECVHAVLHAFPEAAGDQGIDRKKLAGIVFSDSRQLERLNRIVHPFVLERLKQELAAARSCNVLLDAPALFESGADALCDKVICLLAKREIRLNRIVQRDGLTLAQANQRLDAQPTDEFYRSRSDYAVFNNGNRAECLQCVQQLIAECE